MSDFTRMIRNTAKGYDNGGILGDTLKQCADRIDELEKKRRKVWAVIADEYGTSSSSIVHICESEEIANSFRKYEHTIDYAGPVYKVVCMDVKSKVADLEGLANEF